MFSTFDMNVWAHVGIFKKTLEPPLAGSGATLALSHTAGQRGRLDYYYDYYYYYHDLGLY